MIENTLTRRRVAMGMAVAAGAVGLMVAMPASAQEGPEEIEGNPTCGELAPEGVEWIEFKVEPVEDGTYTEGPLTVTITVDDTEDGPTVDWTSNIGVDGVFVKGGPNGNLYTYDESLGDEGLHAPVNPANGDYYGLSHISFCYDEDDTTTTSTMSTTSTTVPTTDTTAPTTDTTAPTTDTTAPTAPKAPVAPVAKPVTGQPTYTG